MTTTAQGRATEGLAEAHLTSLGYTVLERNWRCRFGEIDLVCRDGTTLVFVEVRGRSNRSHGTPEESVDRRKRGRLWRSASAYLQRRGGTPPVCRFDVVAVEGDAASHPVIRVVRDAFRGEGWSA